MSDATLPPLAELSRRGLLKTGGVMLVGFALAGPLTPRTQAQFGPPPGPDRSQIDSWIIIHADNTATVLIGFVELGQGATTALPQVAAEELDLEMDQIRVVAHETEVTPFQGGTYSSSAIANGRLQVQRAAAAARAELMRRAGAQLGVPSERLTVSRGIVSVAGEPGRTVSYGELLGDRPFRLAITGEEPLKEPSAYRIVGQRTPRPDLTEKVMARHTYVQHLRLPGMVHARIVRPRGQGAFGAPPRILAVNEDSIAGMGDARVVRERDFLAVVAAREWDAVRAARALQVEWDIPASLPDSADLNATMRAAPAEMRVVLEEGTPPGAVTHSARFSVATPYQAHAPMAPNCALADVRTGSARVWASSQDIYALRGALAGLLGLDPLAVTVQFAEGSGTYRSQLV